MAFINIVPRTEEYLGYNIKSIPLRVVLYGGVQVTPDVDITTTNLSKGQKHFLNNSGDGDKFKITVLLNPNDTIQGRLETDEPITSSIVGNIYVVRGGGKRISFRQINIIEALDIWIRNMTVITVIADEAVDIPNGEYIITKNQSRTQNRKSGYSIWELEFTRYTGVDVLWLNIDDTYAKKAAKQYEKNKTKNAQKAKEKAKTASTLNNKLSKCTVSKLKYSKTKKVVACVKTLQTYLNKKLGTNLKVDGWYGDETVKAVKKFQNKYKKKYNLTPNGKMDAKTLKAMIKV